MLRPSCWKQEICVGICFKENSVFSYLEFHIQNLYTQRTFSVKISKNTKVYQAQNALSALKSTIKKAALKRRPVFILQQEDFLWITVKSSDVHGYRHHRNPGRYASARSAAGS